MPVTFVRKAAPDDLVLRVAGRLEPKLAKAFLDAVAAMRGSVSLSKLEAALAKGDVDAALAVVAIDTKFVKFLRGDGIESGITSFHEAVRTVFAAGAEAAASQLPRKIVAEAVFDIKSPESISFLEKYQFGLIKQVTADTKDAIRQTIRRAFAEGGHPYQQAREIKNVIGLTSTQEQAVANFRRALSDTTTIPDALGRALRDGRYDATLLRAARNGTNLSPGQIDKMVGRYEERFVQYRAQTIARTESIRASSKGRRDVWRQAKEQGLLGDNAMREWEVSGDERTCDVCMGLDGQQAALDEEYEDGIFEPPDPHPDCLPAGVSVTAFGVTHAVRRWYEGDVCDVGVLGLPYLTVTPNHPVLGEFGWVPAGSLKVGDYVAQCVLPSDAVAPPVGHPNDNYVETGIEKIFDALFVAGRVTTSVVPPSSKAFHGDVGANEKVDVVRSACQLPDGSRIADDVEDLLLAVREGRRISLDGRGFTAEFLKADLHSLASGAGGGRVGAFLGRRPCGGQENVGGAAVALGEAERVPLPDEGTAGDARAAGHRGDALSAQMSFVKVTEVHTRRFYGNVHNLETVDGMYVANGIVTHNCRCSEKLVFAK